MDINKNAQLCDLHVHSTFSDGTFTPTKIIQQAHDLGLGAVALTDHNTIAGLPEFIAAAKHTNVIAIPGVELSTDYEGKELHLVGLFLPEEKFGMINEFTREYIERKNQSNIDLVNNLNKAGYKINYDDILQKNPNHNINRAVIARELLDCGYVTSVKEAFSRLLSKTAGYYNEPKRIHLWEAISFLNCIKAVPVLAHPFLNLSILELSSMLPEARKHGLVGLECLYSEYSQSTMEVSLKLADKYHLLPSGGSDFHGTTKPEIKLGSGMDNLQIPLEYANNMLRKIVFTNK